MAIIRGASLALTDTVINDGSVFLNDPAISATMEIGGVTYLYVPAGGDDAIQVFTVSEDGELTPVGSVTDTGGTALDRPQAVATFQVDGNPFLVATASGDDGITVYSLTGSAPYLTFADAEFDSSNTALQLNNSWTVSVVEHASSATVIVAGYSDDGISSFSVDAAGTITNVSNFNDADDPAYRLNGPFIADTFQRFSATYVAIGGDFESGLSIFRVNTDSSLAFQSNYDGSADDVRPYQVTGVQLGSSVYLVGPAFSRDEIYLFRYDGFATIQLLDRISAPALESAVETRVLEIGDEIYFAVMSFSTDGIALFRLDPDLARLEPIQTVPDNTGQGELSRGHLSAMFEVDGRLFIAAAGEFDNAINVYEIGGGDDLLDGTQIADEIYGGGGDDLIHGLAGDDLIDGGADADLIYAGSGIDTVIASEGEDRLYGGSNYDTFDASGLGGGATGVVVDLRNEQVLLPDGTRQFITNFERIEGTDRDDFLVGDADGNDLRGGSGADTLNGREGADFLRGHGGDDDLNGGTQDDFLFGGNGSDLLNGNFGNDTLDGGADDDSLYGFDGNDVLDGNDGNDILRAGDGDDEVDGGAGLDDLRGDAGNDLMFGGDDADLLFGGGGSDTLNGGDADDVLYGGSGADVFVFDQLSPGGSGFDTVSDFEDGLDRLDFSDYGLDFAAIDSAMSQRSWGVRIDLPDGQVVAIAGFQQTDFDAGDLV